MCPTRVLHPADSIDELRGEVTSAILRILIGPGIVVSAIITWWFAGGLNWLFIAVLDGLFLGSLAVLVWPRMPQNLRTHLLLLLDYLAGTLALVADAPHRGGFPLLLTVVALAGLLLSRRAATLWCSAIIATVIAGTGLYGLGFLQASRQPVIGTAWWFGWAGSFAALAVVLRVAQQCFVRRLAQSLEDIYRDRETLRVSEERYRETFNSIDSAMLIHDEAGQLLDFNDAACAMFGCAREQFREHFVETGGLDAALGSRDEFAGKLRKVASEGPQTFSGQASRFNGERFWCEVALRACTISGEKRLIASWSDITDRKRVEDALEQERTFTNAVLDSVPGILYMFDQEGRPVKWNKKAEEITGYSQEVLAHRLATDWFREEDRERVAKKISDLFKEGSGEVEATLITKNGTAVPFYFTGVRMILNDKAYFTGIGIEITQRYRDEESLRKLSQAVEQSPVNVVITDFEGNIEYVNPKFTELTGYSLAEARGKTPRILKSGHTSDEEYRRLWRTITAGGEWSGELLNKAKNGNLFWERARITSIKDRNGKITHFLAVKEDITEQKQSQEAFRQMQLQLAHVARLSTLGEMAAEMAHELNQPLYAIVNYARAVRNTLAEEGPVQVDRVREWTEEIADVAISAGEVVKRLRSFARRGESPRTLCKIDEIIQEALSLVAADIQRAGVRVEVVFPGAMPPIRVDRVQIQQVLVNLLKNAVESVEASPSDNRRILVNTTCFGSAFNVAVSDSGEGVPAGSETRIFNPFITTKSDGLGIGLSIVRTIVEAHGGRIWVKSNPDRGATFVFSLPFEERRQPDAG